LKEQAAFAANAWITSGMSALLSAFVAGLCVFIKERAGEIYFRYRANPA
jgi:hypothetical protein